MKAPAFTSRKLAVKIVEVFDNMPMADRTKTALIEVSVSATVAVNSRAVGRH